MIQQPLPNINVETNLECCYEAGFHMSQKSGD